MAIGSYKTIDRFSGEGQAWPSVVEQQESADESLFSPAGNGLWAYAITPCQGRDGVEFLIERIGLYLHGAAELFAVSGDVS